MDTNKGNPRTSSEPEKHYGYANDAEKATGAPHRTSKQARAEAAPTSPPNSTTAQ